MPHDSYFQSLSILFSSYSENFLNFIFAFSNDFSRKDQHPQFDFSRTAFCSLFSVFLYWYFLLSNPFEFASFKLLKIVSYSLNYMYLFLCKYLLFSELLVCTISFPQMSAEPWSPKHCLY